MPKTQITTVGYGDITPHTLSETICTIFVLLIGAVAFGASVTPSSLLKLELRPH